MDKNQLITPEDTMKSFTDNEIHMFQSILGSLICYEHTIDLSTRVVINDLVVEQPKCNLKIKHHIARLSAHCLECDHDVHKI